jgi:hypothetical protein
MSQLENVVDFPVKDVFQQITEHCNAPERIKHCCKENNAFKPEMFDPNHEDYIEGLIAVKVGEQIFNKQRSKYQVRPDTINYPKVKQFANQANQGVSNERGKLEFGVRVPLNVIPYNNLNNRKTIVEGVGGFNRDAMLPMTNLTYFPAILDKVFISLKTRYEKNRYLRQLNSHPNNGEENSESAIKNGIASALTTGSGILQDEVAAINEINRQLEDQTIDNSTRRSLKNQRGRLITACTESLLEDTIQDSGYRWSKEYATKCIKGVIKGWQYQEQKAAYSYSDAEMIKIELDQKAKVDSEKVIVKRHGGKANGTKRQICGDLWNLIVNHREKKGKLPTEVRVLVSLTDSGGDKNLHNHRIKFYDYVNRLISDAYPCISLDVRFVGQAQSYPVETPGKLYDIEHVRKNFQELEND